MADLNLGQQITQTKGNKMKLIELKVQPEDKYVFIMYESFDGTERTGVLTSIEIGPEKTVAYDINNTRIDIDMKYDDINLNSLVNLNAVLAQVTNNYDPVPQS